MLRSTEPVKLPRGTRMEDASDPEDEEDEDEDEDDDEDEDGEGGAVAYPPVLFGAGLQPFLPGLFGMPAAVQYVRCRQCGNAGTHPLPASLRSVLMALQARMVSNVLCRHLTGCARRASSLSLTAPDTQPL